MTPSLLRATRLFKRCNGRLCTIFKAFVKSRSAYTPGRPREVVTGEQRLPGLTLPSSTHAMKVGLSEKRSFTPKKAIENLKGNGYQINQNKAQAGDAVSSYDERKPQKREGITVEQTIAMLQKKGLSVTPQQATEILELLRTLAKIEIDNYLKNENS